MTVEDCRFLDVNWLHREGCLLPGWQGLLQWSREGEQIASVGLRAETARLVLSYSSRIGGSDWQPVQMVVLIEQVPCRVGGSRPYFRCPGVVNGIGCGRRAVKFYAASRYYLCRHCYRLTYTSQREDHHDRALRRADRIRRRLGGEAGFEAPLPTRPKGMWQRTYDRLIAEIVQAEDLVGEVFDRRCSYLLRQLER